MKLHISEKLYAEIEDLVMGTGLETGVSLFGTKDGEEFTVVGIAGPGQKATHQEYHYSGDEDYKTDVSKLEPECRNIATQLLSQQQQTHDRLSALKRRLS